MFVGHFAVAFVGKRIEPRLSLGTLLLAAMLSDLLFFIFVLAGIESLEFRPGLGAVNYIAAVNFPFSHSLVMTALWGLVFAAIFYFKRSNKRGAIVLLLAVLSHWLLDVIAHPPDMQIAPGMNGHFGLGLWTSVPATLIVEGSFWMLAIVVYLRATRPKGRLSHFVFWPVVLFLTLAWYANISAPPPSAAIAPIQSLIFFIIAVAWAFWMNRLRPAKSSEG